MADEHAGHRQRMRQRFREQGLKGFAPHEVLELILFYAIPQRNVNPLAHRLLEKFGSLHGVLDASVEELEAVEGVGEYAATLLHLLSDVARQLSLSRQKETGEPFTYGEAKRHCLSLMEGLQEEHFYVVCLDGQMRLIHDVLIAKGGLSEVPVYPRLVARAALGCNAHAVVLCHNHPGGCEVPSEDDLTMTLELAQMLRSIGVVLSDHIVVAEGRAMSMSHAGLLTIADKTEEKKLRTDNRKKKVER